MRNLSLASRNRSLFNKLLNLRYVAFRLASYNCSRRAKYCFGCSFIALLLAGSFIAGNLQAQEKRETGWFVGTTPWSSPIQLEITQGSALASFTDKTNSIRRETTIEEETRVGTDANFSTTYEVELIEGTTIEKESGGEVTDSDRAYIIEIAETICRKEVIGIFNANHATADPYPTELWFMRTGGSDTILQENGCLLPEAKIGLPLSTNSETATTQHTSSSRTITPTGAGITKVNKNLTGSSIHFGHNFEKFRVTFSDSRWNSGENKVQTQMVFADWFLPRDFYAGVGIANSSLATLGASDSSIKPVITFGKSRRLSQRFAIEIGFLYQQIELSVSNNQLSNLSFGTPFTEAEIAGAQRTSTSKSTERLPESIEFRRTMKEAQAGATELIEECNTRPPDPVTGQKTCNVVPNPASSFVLSNLEEHFFKREKTEVRPTRVITVAGDVEKTTNTKVQDFTTTTTTEGTGEIYQNDVKVTIPSSIFIKIYFSF